MPKIVMLYQYLSYSLAFINVALDNVIRYSYAINAQKIIVMAQNSYAIPIYSIQSNIQTKNISTSQIFKPAYPPPPSPVN